MAALSVLSPTADPAPQLVRPRIVLEHPDFYLVDKPPMWLTSAMVSAPTSSATCLNSA